ncbi:hypothetical protein [Streptomyces sp. WAC06614]|uniref:hypothetical protein n=1 Tax=Streptomyces sp. WAC06614 TaxID=2487416 RepID=UPI000F77FF33|nr:hypothetical protein [Streptomyces sp. WAC06614]RSS70321.1 hypothetical protein EF918_27235 [Streptomyces sp. WAC06614]
MKRADGITLTLRALHHGERKLARELATVAERHRTEHEVHHVAADLVRWSEEHCRRLAETGSHYGLSLAGPPDPPTSRVLASLREKSAEAVGRRPEAGLLLLYDLRRIHLTAAGNSLYWEMLAQAAQAARDERLLELASACHPRTLRQMRWTNTLIKNLSPQILTSG